MLIVISPAKTLDYETPLPTVKASQPTMLKDSQVLMDDLKQLAPQDISKLMGISDKLATLNYDRFQSWKRPFTAKNARPAALAFKGDVYEGMQAYDFSAKDFAFAQEHLRILSGLYGLLRPLDRIQPYRLEMGTRLQNSRGSDLYDFWEDKITRALNKQLSASKSKALINLASQEYFKSVSSAKIVTRIITPIFKDWKNGQYKIISFSAKKARGMMSAYIIKKKILNPEHIKKFNVAGYSFNDAMSDADQWVFTRKEG